MEEKNFFFNFNEKKELVFMQNYDFSRNDSDNG